MRKLLCIVGLSGLLLACGGDEQTATIPASWSPTNTLTYAYPYNGQSRIAPSSPLVLHFASALKETDTVALAARFSLSGPTNPGFTASLTDGGRGVVLTPLQKLQENASYTLSWSGLAAADGDIRPVPLRFSTRPADQGPRARVSDSTVLAAAPFTVARTLPDQAGFPMMDFSSVRVQFTQPLNPKTLRYGSSVKLVDASNALVPARILVSKRLLTIDPIQDLTPGQRYTLVIDSSLKSSLGDSFGPSGYLWSFTPQDSKPRATIALEVPDSNAGTIVSSLTGAAINNVPIMSTLLGNNSASQQGGNLFAELAFIPNYPKASPMRVPRGNILTGSSVAVNLVGQVPTGLNTGAIRVDVISDANGYMVDNPYSKAADAPKQVVLVMDMAMSAADPTSNGGFNQNLMHVPVVGTAIVKNGRLVMDAVGVVELDVLGVDQAYGVLSFHLEGYQDQVHAPQPAVDTTAPTLQSMTPFNENTGIAERARPGESVILTFTEPLDPDSITASSLQFTKGGVAEPFDWRLDGTALILQPQTPLAYGASYAVQFSSDIKDVAGNGVSDASHSRSFTLPAIVSPATRSPVVLASYPGYPCPSKTGTSSFSLSGGMVTAGLQGRCRGTADTDDLMPLAKLPADRGLQIQFSQDMNPASINNASFKVETSSNATALENGSWTAVPGRIELNGQALSFYPDTPWSEGRLYRYTLVSNDDRQSSACAPASQICGANGLPLQTRLFAQEGDTVTAATGGGPNMVIPFTVVAPVKTTWQRLVGLPGSDVNANFVHDAGEVDAVDNGGGQYSGRNAGWLQVKGVGGLIKKANVGCDVDSTCPLKQFLFQTSAMDAEVADYDAGQDAVRVQIQPPLLLATGLTIYTTAALGTPNPAPTGVQIMRGRYAVNPANGKRELPITGYIRNVGGQLRMEVTMDLYLDTPELVPTLELLGTQTLKHNMRSVLINGVKISGPVSFLPDGRMVVSLSNENEVNFTTVLHLSIGLHAGDIHFKLAPGNLKLEAISGAIKR